MKPSDENQGNTFSKFINTESGKTKSNALEIPALSLPKGGGAIKGIDEKFSVNASNGTSSISVPLPFSPARGVTPALSITYNSGSGNSIFGLGWQLSLASIKRKTDKGLPQYLDETDSDTFLFSGAEDLVPEFSRNPDGSFLLNDAGEFVIHERNSPDDLFTIRYYKPRIEGLFARIERWTDKSNGRIRWRVISKDNLTTLFGWTDQSIMVNPQNTLQIYEWLPEFVFDDKGNCSQYLYNREDNTGFDESLLHNRNRILNGNLTYTNLYLAKVLYGNIDPYQQAGDPFPPENSYLFQTVFDYGTTDILHEPFDQLNPWDFRPDAFSEYRPGFEIRTTRLCKRVLLFHVFDELAHRPDKSDRKTLVRSLNFEYDNSADQDFTFLKSITACGYIKSLGGSYSFKNLPPFGFGYQRPEWNREIRTISSESLINAPSGIDQPHYQFVDLFNEGLSGILTEQADGWYYKHNLGNGQFGQLKEISEKPSFSGLGGQMHLTDLDADGGKQLVNFSTEPKGFFELDNDQRWHGLRSFKTLPNIDFGDANTRMIDMDGDGRAEIVVSEDHAFTWYASDGRNGYSDARHTFKSINEEEGPHLVFKDNQQSIFLADMSGDGLTDLVRIRNGEVCYWPNLGYGKFGAKTAMDHAPVFDHPGSFNPEFIRLADIDGSGTADIIYLGKNKFTCWQNLSGNRFSDIPVEIDPFPEIHPQSEVTVTDLLGNGVACIVWSGALLKDSGASLKYIDLMNGKKPHLMVSCKNNLGREISLEYTASTRFYLDDKLSGKPWITRLHFPVHCVSKIITEDKISGHRLVSEYKYHHGYYDHAEREFRGFGMVEQTDAENFEHWVKGNASSIVEEPLHQEPVVTKSWFHTGAFLRNDKILKQFSEDYWYEEMARQQFEATHHEADLPDARITGAPGLEAYVAESITAQEWQEALRACKGMPLRTETFARDAFKYGSTPDALRKELTPFSVSSGNCLIELLQPKGKNKHAVYLVKESESITYHYERNPEDPRIAHTLNIKTDEYGHVLESAAVVYPRLMPDLSLPAETRVEQSKTVIIYSLNQYTKDVTDIHTHRLRLPSEAMTFELKGVAKSGWYYTPADFTGILSDIKSDTASYHELNKPLIPGKAQKRLIEHLRSSYYRNDLIGPLPLHELESMAIPCESFQLAYTPDLLNDIFGSKVTPDLLTEGKFVHSVGDSNWWIRSGSIQYLNGPDTAADARNRFYMPLSYTDPGGAVTKVKYYGNYYHFIEETEDATGNKTSVESFNFRTLSPVRMKDINGNLSSAISDELGMIKAVAIMGKGEEADELTGISETTSTDEANLIMNFLQADGSGQLISTGKQLLNRASVRFVYDPAAYLVSGKPAFAVAITREQHYHQMADSPVQMAFEYTNGMGEVIMKKVQAEPGMARQVTLNEDGTVAVNEINTAEIAASPLRWIGNGRTVRNNKGKAVKQYEPFFSVTWLFEDHKELSETGVTPKLFYDAAGRLIKTELPDGTISKVTFDAWKQSISDTHDTILDSPWYINRTNRLIDAQLTAEGKNPEREKVAADKAARHANTPLFLHFDSLGRPVLSVDHNKNIQTEADEFYETRVSPDAEGNPRSVTDARGNLVMQYKYDMLGNKVYHNSMDTGQRWLLTNIFGQPLRTWDERNHEFRYFYDILHRPLHSKVMGGDGPVPLDHIFDRVIYGESLLTPDRSNESALQSQNVLGKVIFHYDTGGVVESHGYDFKGQPLSTTRKLFRKYKETANWTDGGMTDDLEPGDGFTFSTQTDALGRIIRQTAPDGAVITPFYNQTGLLAGESVIHPDSADPAVYIKNIEYNEKGRREKIVFGNDVTTRFFYDRETFRLKRLESKKLNGDLLQDWYYTYDPAGNITHIEDKNIPVIFFDNHKISGEAQYTYDALYRLVEATGRENNAALSFGHSDNWSDQAFMQGLNPGDPMFIRDYKQQYFYDPVGNILQMKHISEDNNWTRDYNYESHNNRMISTQVGTQTYIYPHHLQHGYMTALPHLQETGWNFKEELVKTIRQKRTDGGAPETTWYQYDGSGKRIRKITENQADPGVSPTKKEERIYISGYEIYKKHSGANAGLERVSLSLMDEGHRFVLTETRNQIDDGTEKHLVRYQLHNHLGSAALELDETARVISYEEYHPYGTTAYQAMNTAIKSAAKRYRYTGMERDEETGLGYHGARYYLPWLGRWLNADPSGIKDGINRYVYSKNSPITRYDINGKQSASVTGSARITRALEEADRANFDDASVNRALQAIDEEIRSRGFSYYFTRDAAMAHALLRAEAYARHSRQGNYGRATFHATMGVIDSFGYAMMGDTPAESARNFAISMVVGATFSRLAAAGRASQLEIQASSDALAARVASRSATRPLLEAPATNPPVSETPPALPNPTPRVAGPAAQQAVRPPQRSTVSTPEIDPDATPPHGTRIPVRPRVAVDADRPEFFAISDTSNPRFQASGQLSDDGVLTMTIRTVVDGARSTVLRGSEAFQRILGRFGSSVRAIRGSWSYGDNLARFNQLTAEGLSPEQAALRTWTGTQASHAGFTQASITNLEGTPGAYTKVEVLFTRPSP